MSCQTKVLSQTPNGRLTVCEYSNRFTLVFKNIFLELDVNQYQRFKEFIQFLDVSYWEAEYKHITSLTRKIPIPTSQENLILMFRADEINELEILFNIRDKKKPRLISLFQMKENIILN